MVFVNIFVIKPTIFAILQIINPLFLYVFFRKCDTVIETRKDLHEDLETI